MLGALLVAAGLVISGLFEVSEELLEEVWGEMSGAGTFSIDADTTFFFT